MRYGYQVNAFEVGTGTLRNDSRKLPFCGNGQKRLRGIHFYDYPRLNACGFERIFDQDARREFWCQQCKGDRIECFPLDPALLCEGVAPADGKNKSLREEILGFDIVPRSRMEAETEIECAECQFLLKLSCE